MELTFRILGFGPFEDSGEFTVSPGLNVFTGLNNAGKTALLYALFALRAGPVAADASAWAGLGREQQRIASYGRRGQQPRVQVRADPDEPTRRRVLERLPVQFRPQGARSLLFDSHVASGGITLGGIAAGAAGGGWQTVIGAQPTPECAAAPASHDRQVLSALSLELAGSQLRAANAESLNKIGWPSVLSGARLIAALREAPEPTNPGADQALRLLPNASNLPSVLYALNNSYAASGPEALERIRRHLRDFFPGVSTIRTAVTPSSPGSAQHVLELVADRDQTVVPIGRFGTGVWQTLVLITAALVEDGPRLFLIDEHHSFLHPAAERQLVGLLESVGREKGHIFCVATHSHIIANRATSRLWGVFDQNGASTVRRLSGYRDAVSAIGIEAADLLAHDAILTVEGPSDQYVLRSLLDGIGASRVAVTRLWGHGPVRGSDGGEQLRRIAKDLVGAVAPVHVPMTLLLDRAGWGESDITELEANGGARFLEKPEIENYFLHPEAIAQGFGLTGEQAEAVKQRIAGAAASAKGSDVISKALWEAAHISYRKAQHLPRIFEALREVDDAALEPLRAEVREIASYLLNRSDQ